MEEDVPLFGVEVGDVGGHHDGGDIGFFTGLHGFATDVTDAKGEDAVGLHGVVVFGADEAFEDVTVVVDVAVLGDFESGPEAEVAAADFAVGGAEDDMAAEGILFEEEFESGVEFFGWDLPGDEGAFGEFVGEEGLADAADDAGFEHGADALDDGVEVDAAFFGDELERVLQETFHAVFADGEDAGVDFFGVFGGDFESSGHGAGLQGINESQGEEVGGFCSPFAVLCARLWERGQLLVTTSSRLRMRLARRVQAASSEGLRAGSGLDSP